MYTGGGLRKIIIELFELYYFYIEINYIQDKTYMYNITKIAS